MSVVNVDEGGRLTLPKETGVRKTRAVVIPAGSFIVIVPLPPKPSEYTKDWLKTEKKRIENGPLGVVYVTREVLHELYYVSMEEGISIDEFIARAAAVTAIKNLVFVETDYTIDLLAFTLIRQYNLTSIFDAYYAATALNKVPHTIISTDIIFYKIPGIKRIDPRKIVEKDL